MTAQTVSPRRVVVTGVGSVSCVGVGIDALWNGLYSLNGGKIQGFDPIPHLGRKTTRRTDLFEQIGLVAAMEAVDMAGGVFGDSFRRGVVFANSVGGNTTLLEQMEVLGSKGQRFLNPIGEAMWMPNAVSASIARKYQCQGPTRSLNTACAAGLDAIVDGHRLIAHDYADTVIVGGGEIGIVTPHLEMLTATNTVTPSGVPRPFDKARDGLLPADGAGVLVLEELDAARDRGARILAEVAGTGATNDAYNLADPLPDGSGMAQAINLALGEAGLSPSDIGWVNPHAAGTPIGDASETNAIYQALGKVSISSTKGAIGHCFSGTGAIEGIICVLSIQKGIIPPTIGLVDLDTTLPDLDYVGPSGKTWEPGHVLSTNTALGNHNAAAIFSAFQD